MTLYSFLCAVVTVCFLYHRWAEKKGGREVFQCNAYEKKQKQKKKKKKKKKKKNQTKKPGKFLDIHGVNLKRTWSFLNLMVI